ncbi:MAG: hypothetical protein KAJ58_02195 [Candidatus Pacebacteria bacterium]|nr:hypothetical protein [Candidatus Paceibacterota bacterium]
MSQDNEVQKILYERWLVSAQKWWQILEKIQRKNVFSWNNGFSDLNVNEVCGYCNYYQSCKQCYLSRILSSYISICYAVVFTKSHYGIFLSEMRKNSPNFEIAEYHCKVILDVILEDCPDKERAIEDGIVFE